MRSRFGLLIILAIGSPLHADNFLANGLFPDNLDGWSTTGNTWTHETSNEFGWAEVISTGAGQQTLSQCAPLVSFPEGRSVSFGGYANTVAHSSPVEYELELFASTDCSGAAAAAASETVAAPTQNAWLLYYAPVTVPAGIMSARLTATVTTSAASQKTRFDTISLRSDIVTDGHFTSNLDWWVPTPAANWSIVNDGGSLPLGAAQGTVADDGSLFLAQCMPLDNFAISPVLYSVIRVKALDTVAGQTYLLSYHFHEDGCGGPLLSQPGYNVTPAQTGVWQTFFNFVYPPPTADSVVIYFALNGGQGTPGTQLMIDDYVLTVSDVIIQSFFEDGDLSEWSS